MSVTVCNCEIEWNDQAPTGLRPNKKMPPPPGSFPRVLQLEVNTFFGTCGFPPSILGALPSVKQTQAGETQN